MAEKSPRVCPVERAGALDNRIRKWLQNPGKMLRPYIRQGMTVLDMGCGPGFFSIAMAEMVGNTGKVIAADLQEGMLQKLGDKIRGWEIEARIRLHQCREDKIGVTEGVDFILVFYMMHEVPDQAEFLAELTTILKPGGKLFIAEPKFHVSKKAFKEMITKACELGLTPVEEPKIFLSRTIVLKKVND